MTSTPKPISTVSTIPRNITKTWELPGGVHPAENKSQSLKLPLINCPLADEYILPLNQHIGAPSLPLVRVGDRVKKYQRIADAEGIFSASLHAPTSGLITAIEDRFIAHPSGLKAPCIVLQADGNDEACELIATENPYSLDHPTLIEKIRGAGLVGMGGAGFPSAVKLNPKSSTPIHTLIINGTECEPYITADDILMQTYAEEVIAGSQLLAHILGHSPQVIIGVEDNKPEAITALKAAAQNTNIQIASFPTKYPSGGEKQLIYILTGQEVASGQLPAALGIVLHNVGTTVAAWRAVRYGEPLIERITTIVGQALTTQRNMRVRIGTPIQHVLDHNGYNARRNASLIIGGPMMGFAIEQTSIPVVKTTNCLLVPSHAEMPPAPPAQACIRCGHCADACPAGLLPQQLYWYARADDHSKLKSHNLFDCIECGACAYVCPSTIPLVQYYRSAKGDIRQADLDKKKSDQARERFERRQERLAEEEAAKEAKRQERKAVAERNKARLADINAESTSNTANSRILNDLVANAVDAAAKQTPNPAQEHARLARTLESLNSRIARLEGQISSEQDETRREKFAAQIKQTQQSLNETQTKIAAIGTNTSTVIENQISKVTEKLNASPIDLAQKSLATLQKRLATAEEKWAEAKAEGKATADALTQGVEKLKQKVIEAEQALNAIQQSSAPQSPDQTVNAGTSNDAANAAIERAKQKAQAAAAMTPEQKQAAAIQSLEQRWLKAKERLAKAQEDNDENIEAFAASVEKLEQKMLALQAEGTS